MTKSSEISDQDLELFRQAVKDSTPIKQDIHIPDRPKPEAKPNQSEADNDAVMQELHLADFDHTALERGDELLYYRPGFQKKALSKLRRGQYNIEAELDLHGMTVDIAKQALSDFLKNCAMKNKRCVRIIHGKGLGSKNKQPVIKNKLNIWLQQRADVLAFCSARPIDGGTGAIYLLLKTN